MRSSPNKTLSFLAWALRQSRALPTPHPRQYYMHLLKSEVRSYADVRDPDAIAQLLAKGRSHVTFILAKYSPNKNI